MKAAIIGVVGFVAVIVAVISIAAFGNSGGKDKISEAYAYAQSSPEQLDGISCFCGCMQHQHDGRLHTRGLLDCFVKEDGSYEKHGSECNMCIEDALEVKALSEKGVPKDEISRMMIMKYTGGNT